MEHVIALEMHESSVTALNYLSIGGYNTSVVKYPNWIEWVPTYCEEHWEIEIQALFFGD